MQQTRGLQLYQLLSYECLCSTTNGTISYIITSIQAFFCQKGLDINIHNSVTNNARDLQFVAFKTSPLVLSMTRNLNSPNGSKKQHSGSENTPFFAQIMPSLDLATFEQTISILIEDL